MPGTGALPWAASHARAIPLFDYAARPPLGRQPTLVPRRWPDKDTTGALDFVLDARDWLTASGLRIVTVTATSVPGDLAVATPLATGGLVTVWLSGGTPGQLYTVTVALALSAAQFLSVPVDLFVPLDAVTLPIPPAQTGPGTLAQAITGTGGAVLTDSAGNPISLAP
jgi:hypothetical protein